MEGDRLLISFDPKLGRPDDHSRSQVRHKEGSLLDKVEVGDRVDFTVVETKKGEYLTEIKRSSSAATPSPK